MFQNYYVEVQEKPSFNLTPVSRKYPNAQTLRLYCNATGHPKPKIYWLKDGKKLDIGARVKKSPSGIVFSHSFIDDKGIY